MIAMRSGTTRVVLLRDDSSHTTRETANVNIKYEPQDPNHPRDKRGNTNIGEFLPGEVRGVSPDQEKEARRLIANGDFIETDEAPNSDLVHAALFDAAVGLHKSTPRTGTTATQNAQRTAKSAVKSPRKATTETTGNTPAATDDTESSPSAKSTKSTAKKK